MRKNMCFSGFCKYESTGEYAVECQIRVGGEHPDDACLHDERNDKTPEKIQ